MKTTDSNIYPLPNTNDRWLHLGTVHDGMREFMCFLDRATFQCYIEELTGGHLSYIENNKLAATLADYCAKQGVSDIMRVMREAPSLSQRWTPGSVKG